MKTINNTPSKYEITWIEFVAETGKPLKKDIIKINGYRHIGNALDRNGKYYKHFASKAEAVEFLQGFNKELDKRYACRLFTDKQFSMRKAENGYEVPFTEKQMNEVYYI